MSVKGSSKSVGKPAQRKKLRRKKMFRKFFITAASLFLMMVFVSNSELIAQEKESKNNLPSGKHETFEEMMKSMKQRMDSMMENPFFSDPSLKNLKGFDLFDRSLNDRFGSILKEFDMDSPFWGRSKGWLGSFGEVKSDVREENGNLIVTVDLPGHDKKSLDLKIKDNSLIITSERKSQSTSEKDNKVYRNEISYGRFSRVIELPRKVLADKIKATLENGVLTVIAPIDPSQPPIDEGQKIEIQ